jgi:hypothetical protein
MRRHGRGGWRFWGSRWDRSTTSSCNDTVPVSIHPLNTISEAFPVLSGFTSQVILYERVPRPALTSSYCLLIAARQGLATPARSRLLALRDRQLIRLAPGTHPRRHARRHTQRRRLGGLRQSRRDAMPELPQKSLIACSMTHECGRSRARAMSATCLLRSGESRTLIDRFLLIAASVCLMCRSGYAATRAL